MRSKDGELLHILGLTPIERPELWERVCMRCKKGALRLQSLTAQFNQPPEIRFMCTECGVIWDDITVHPVGLPSVRFGLDAGSAVCSPDTDALCFKHILPWWRRQKPRVRFAVRQELERILTTRPLVNPFEQLLLHPHPGPTLAQAVHTALYETINKD